MQWRANQRIRKRKKKKRKKAIPETKRKTWPTIKRRRISARRGCQMNNSGAYSPGKKMIAAYQPEEDAR